MKRIVALLLCALILASVFPAFAAADSDYSTVSNRNVKLKMPKSGEYLKEPFEARINASDPYGAIYFMPKPQAGNGHLGTVDDGEIVTILAEHGGYYFFETDDGRQGWNGKTFFGYIIDENGDKQAATFRTKSTKDVDLLFPLKREYLKHPFTRTVESCSRIYLMPKPEAGNGNLGTVEDGEEVTILAEVSGFYFFKTEDGRYGWNGKVYFK